MSATNEKTRRKLDLHQDVLEFLKSLQGKQCKQVTLSILALAEDARPHDSKLLKGFSYYRIDVGEYRVIYRFDAETVYVVDAGKRNDNEVYRWLKR